MYGSAWVGCVYIILVSYLLASLYPWSPRDVTKAKAITQYNLATAHAIRGEYEKALQYLTEVSVCIQGLTQGRTQAQFS